MLTLAERSQGKSEYSVIRDNSQREKLKQRCMQMVEAAGEADTVIFLDKGARPLATIFTALYPYVHPENIRPQIRFINFGREKVAAIKDYGESVSSLSQLQALFGIENVQILMQLLGSQKQEQRLVIDDINEFGLTRKSLEGVLAIVDPDNHYSFFALIHRKPGEDVHGRGKNPSSPWTPGITLVKDTQVNGQVDQLPFLTTRETRPDFRTQGLQLRTELLMLAREIVTGKVGK